MLFSFDGLRCLISPNQNPRFNSSCLVKLLVLTLVFYPEFSQTKSERIKRTQSKLSTSGTPLITPMISQLSARLLGDQASSRSGSSNRSFSSSTKDGPKSSIGGYTADKEEHEQSPFSSEPPLNIDFLIKQKSKRNSLEGEECAKRRRMNESNYAASTVRDDLARAGLPYPELMTADLRSSILANMDKNRLRLISSKDVTSPFLAPVVMGWDTKITHDLVTDYVYNDMLKSYSAFYGTPCYTSQQESSLISSEDTESTSSISDTASDDSQPLSMLVTGSRLDDTLKKKLSNKTTVIPTPFCINLIDISNDAIIQRDASASKSLLEHLDDGKDQMGLSVVG
jgi:hypothetical protein